MRRLARGAGGRTRIEIDSDANAATGVAIVLIIKENSRNLIKIDQIPAILSLILQPHERLFYALCRGEKKMSCLRISQRK